MKTKLVLRKLMAIVMIGMISAISSCVTVFNGTKQKVTFTSNPAGAEIYVNGQNTGLITPAEVQVKRKVKETDQQERNEQYYVLKKEGYHNYEILDKSTLIPYAPYLWYVTLGVSALVDVPLGSHRQYSKKQKVTLIKDEVREIVKTEYIRDTVFMETEGGMKYFYQFQRKSDVDRDIPKVPTQNPKKFALIIGNEDYKTHQADLSSEVNVDFARNDASAFKDYAINVLGVPERNAFLVLDATSAKMRQALNKISALTRVSGGETELIFYYAGHGLPDEVTKEAYLIPVDVSGKDIALGIRLKDLYNTLTEHPSKRVTVFLDACFSGGARNQGLIAARGVAIRAQENLLAGNLVSFSASSGEQSSMPFKDKEHGLFTYYLLKKLKETQGNVSYDELSSYLKETVAVESILTNSKEQTPQVNVSSTVVNSWANWKLNE